MEQSRTKGRIDKLHLTADIDLTGKDWTQIGTSPGYSGVFNGQGHRITG